MPQQFVKEHQSPRRFPLPHQYIKEHQGVAKGRRDLIGIILIILNG
jgi:hypothetical protein